MSDKTSIEWADATWNPVTGCTEVSPGCDHCYAKTFAERFRGTPGHYFEGGFDVQLRLEKLDQPLRWKRPRRIFVNSMSDLFHDSVPDEYIARVFAVMALAPRHTFQVLTKRHARMRSLLSRSDFRELMFHHGTNRADMDDWSGDWLRTEAPWPLPNVWLGVSTENQQWADTRIPALLATPAAVRFISAEPLLGPIDLTRIDAKSKGQPRMVHDAVNGRYGVPGRWSSRLSARLDWVIAGGESGRGARPMHPGWARGLRDQCQAAGVPFLFKQWGEYRPAIPGTDTWDQVETFPFHLDVPMIDGAEGEWTLMRRVGKHRAGRLLDGRTWDEFPV